MSILRKNNSNNPEDHNNIFNNPEDHSNIFLSFLHRFREALGYSINAPEWANSQNEIDDSHTSGITAVWFPFIAGHSIFWEGLQESIVNRNKNNEKPVINTNDLDESHTSGITAVGSPFIPGHDQFGEKTRKRIAKKN